MTEALPADPPLDNGRYNPFSTSVLADVRRAIRETPEIGSEHFDTAYDAAILMLVGEGDLQVMFEPLVRLAGVSRLRATSIAEGIWRTGRPSRSWRPK